MHVPPLHLRGEAVQLEVGERVLAAVTKVIDKHRRAALQEVDLDAGVDRVREGTVSDGVHQAAGILPLQLLGAPVELLHLLSHHLWGLTLAVVETKHHRTELLKALLKLSDAFQLGDPISSPNWVIQLAHPIRSPNWVTQLAHPIGSPN